MFTTGQTQQNVLAAVQSKLTALRTALSNIADEHAWSAGCAASDLVALGFSTADANSILSAINDANALNDYWTVGHPLAPAYASMQPAQDYIYGTSAATVIGP